MTDFAPVAISTVPRIIVADVTVFAVSTFDPQYPSIPAERPNVRVRTLHHYLHLTLILAFAKGIFHEGRPCLFFLSLFTCVVKEPKTQGLQICIGAPGFAVRHELGLEAFDVQLRPCLVSMLRYFLKQALARVIQYAGLSVNGDISLGGMDTKIFVSLENGLRHR